MAGTRLASWTPLENSAPEFSFVRRSKMNPPSDVGRTGMVCQGRISWLLGSREWLGQDALQGFNSKQISHRMLPAKQASNCRQSDGRFWGYVRPVRKRSELTARAQMKCRRVERQLGLEPAIK